ncbi:MAG: hypothetical protein KDK44_02265 [Chlamydiia bacterium]|nr:hypothetical protein [Chlamydiia bacterium]MCP5510170.1 hypothetical protein [Chlamydiales bacterium]HPE84561.1 hypothetical protein [Chlamydiales bacterium]
MFEDVPSLSPVSFFKLQGKLRYAEEQKILGRSYVLPDTSPLLNEEPFAAVSMAWNEKALLCAVKVRQGFEESHFPDVAKGDSLELFIDTRDLKTAGAPTRFCHHFVFFPHTDFPSQEITRLRAEEMRPLADQSDLHVNATFERKSYLMEIAITRDALFGYDPTNFKRLGLTYRVNRYGGNPQHFALSSFEYSIEKHPALWASFELG